MTNSIKESRLCIKKILFAVEFSHADSSVKKIKELVEFFQVKLYLIHVIEIPTLDGFPDAINKEILYLNQAKKKLARIGESFNVSI